jgi:hypothetical protein
VPPAVHPLAAELGGHHGHNRREHSVGTVPADEVHRLKCFVEEIKRMTGVGKIAVGDGGQGGGCEPLRGCA